MDDGGRSSVLISATTCGDGVCVCVCLCACVCARVFVRACLCARVAEDVNGEALTLMVPYCDLANHCTDHNSTFCISKDLKR